MGIKNDNQVVSKEKDMKPSLKRKMTIVDDDFSNPSKKCILMKNSSQEMIFLPTQLNDLKSFFNALEFALGNFSRFHQQPVFTKLKKSVEASCKREITHQHIAQILGIYPNAYKIAVVKMVHDGSLNENEAYDLSIKRPICQETTSDRVAKFHTLLLEYIQLHRQKVPLLSHEKWMEYASTIPLSEVALPSFPTKKTTPKSLVPPSWNNQLDENEKLALAEQPVVSKELQGLPAWLVEKVRLKGALMNKCAKNLKETGDRLLTSMLPQLCDQLESYSRVTSKSAFYVADFQQNLPLNSRGLGQIKEQMRRLSQMVPQWITLMDDKRNGLLVQFNRKVKFSDIRSQVVEKSNSTLPQNS